MFFPYSTDAPIYFWPIATVGLIVVNVLAYVGAVTEKLGTIGDWIVEFGNGLHPLQWLSSMFMHADPIHLIGNMIFLWIFGLVVEGKLGWWKFLACYLMIGVTQSMFSQIVMLGYEGLVPGALGASAAIYGLMGMAAVWAPINDVTFVTWFRGRSSDFDIPIYFVAVFYGGLDCYSIIQSGGGIVSGWFHLVGLAIGVPLAIALLKANVVDCEGWDLFHVIRGEYGANKIEPTTAEITAKVDAHQRRRDEGQRTSAQEQCQLYLQQGNFVAAIKLHEKMKGVAGGLAFERGQLLAIIKWLHGEKRWKDSAPFMAEVIQRFPDAADAVRIKLAQICLVELSRPGKALELLAEADIACLTERQVALAKKIAAKAKQLQMDGVVELDVETW